MELSMSKGSLCDQLWQTVHTIIIVSKTLKVVPLTCSRRTPGIVVFVLLACRECTLITLSFYFQQKLSIAIKINNDLMKITRGFFFCVASPGPKSIICFEKKKKKIWIRDESKKPFNDKFLQLSWWSFKKQYPQIPFLSSLCHGQNRSSYHTMRKRKKKTLKNHKAAANWNKRYISIALLNTPF